MIDTNAGGPSARGSGSRSNFSISGEADVDLRLGRLRAGRDQLRQPVQGLRAEHQVDVGRPLHDRLAFLAGHAAADADDQPSGWAFSAFQRPSWLKHLLLRLLADRAGVEQHDVGLLADPPAPGRRLLRRARRPSGPSRTRSSGSRGF
jgi:hypothetical protein